MVERQPIETPREWVERTCAAQGVKVKVSDPAVMRQVAALLNPEKVRHATIRVTSHERRWLPA